GSSMKLISFLKHGRSCIGAMHPVHATQFLEVFSCAQDDQCIIKFVTEIQLVQEAQSKFQQALENSTSAWQNIDEIVIQPVIPRPGKIICVGLNYADHAKEGGNAKPEYPSFFLRGHSSLVAHSEPMILS